MSHSLPARPAVLETGDLSIALVAGRYNERYVSALVENAAKELRVLAPSVQTEVFWAPGSFEIPLLVKLAAESGRFEAVMAFGVILQGETAHATLIAQSVTDALQRLALEFRIPVTHEVLLLQNENQARARCLDQDLNRGVEAARAAISCLQTARALRN